jgi:hypothetical protein
MLSWYMDPSVKPRSHSFPFLAKRGGKKDGCASISGLVG